jgi:PAS domain S-box-containing protein
MKTSSAIGAWFQENESVEIVSPRMSFNRSAIRQGLIVFAGYYIVAKLSTMLFSPDLSGPAFWLPNSVLLAALLLNPFQVWWLLLLSAFPAYLICALQGGVPLGPSFGWFICGSLAAVIGAAGTSFLKGPSARFDTVRSMGFFVLCAIGLGPALATFLNLGFTALGQGNSQASWPMWSEHFVSAAFATLILAPMILTWQNVRLSDVRAIASNRLFECVVFFSGLLISSLAFFLSREGGGAGIPTFFYVIPLFLAWAALRLGPAVTTAAIFTSACFLVVDAVHGRELFPFLSPRQNLLFTQIYFIGISIPILFLAVSIAQRMKMEKQFGRLFRSSPDGIIISCLKDGRILETNERWEQIFGYGHREAISQTISSLGIFACEADHRRILESVFAAEGWRDLELSLRTKTGELRDTLISAEIDNIENDRCLILIIRDITDRKHAVLQERSRIAQDIHDDLGARLTAISLLSDLSRAPGQSPKEVRSGLRQIASQIQLCSQSIDEIVWAVSPQQDTLEGFINYLQAYASEAFQLAGLRCRFQLPSPPPARHLSSEVRHNLFMACREAINNVIKHAAATEVFLRMVFENEVLIVAIADNGIGLGSTPAEQSPNVPGARGNHGLSNLRTRLASVGGRSEIWSETGKGTCVTLSVDFRKLDGLLNSRPETPKKQFADSYQ